jgi:hypothetical protein
VVITVLIIILLTSVFMVYSIYYSTEEAIQKKIETNERITALGGRGGDAELNTTSSVAAVEKEETKIASAQEEEMFLFRP